MADAVDGELDAAVGEALAVEAIGEPELAQQLDARVLEDAGAHAVLDVGPVALLEHDAVDAASGEQVGEHEPGRTGADDRHLGLVACHAAHDARDGSASTAGGSRLRRRRLRLAGPGTHRPTR